MPRFLNSEIFGKSRHALANALCKCSLFLVGVSMPFDADLVCKFCLAWLKELLHSSSNDLFPKIAPEVCSSVCLQRKNRAFLVTQMLRCALDSISCTCQVNVVYKVNQLFELVHYIVDNCQDVSLDGRRTVSELLYSSRSNLYNVYHMLLANLRAIQSLFNIHPLGINCCGIMPQNIMDSCQDFLPIILIQKVNHIR